MHHVKLKLKKKTFEGRRPEVTTIYMQDKLETESATSINEDCFLYTIFNCFLNDKKKT